MVNKFIKLMIMTGLVLSLCGCMPDPKEVYDGYVKCMEKMETHDTMQVTSALTLTLELKETGDKLNVRNVSDYKMMDLQSNPKIEMTFTEKMEGFMQADAQTKAYLVDDMFYMDLGEYRIKENTSSVADERFRISFTPYAYEDITRITGSQTPDAVEVQISLNDKALKEVLNRSTEALGLTFDELGDNNFRIVYTIDPNDNIVSDELKGTFDMKISGMDASGTLSIRNIYNLKNITAEIPSDLSAYKYAEEIQGADVTLGKSGEETLKNRLVSWLGYEEKDNVYSVSVNELEGFVFDFNNHLFIHRVSDFSYTYDWTTKDGVYDSCIYNFTEKYMSGKCEESAVEGLKRAKEYFDIELEQCHLAEQDVFGE